MSARKDSGLCKVLAYGGFGELFRSDDRRQHSVRQSTGASVVRLVRGSHSSAAGLTRRFTPLDPMAALRTIPRSGTRSALLGRRARGLGLLVSASALLVGTAGAQAPARQSYSRADLEQAAQEAERNPKTRSDAALLRSRLQNGDFAPGDRIVLELRGDSAVFDTLTVRSGPSLRIANIPDVPLKGVLRSELQDYLTKYLARYIREPDVRTETLIRLSVLGEVGKPGFYDFNSDILLTDAIMAAGGPTGAAAIERSTIRRGKAVILAKSRVQRAAQSGATLDRLGLRPGDAIEVGQKRRRMDAQAIIGITGAVASLALSLIWLARN